MVGRRVNTTAKKKEVLKAHRMGFEGQTGARLRRLEDRGGISRTEPTVTRRQDGQ